MCTRVPTHLYNNDLLISTNSPVHNALYIYIPLAGNYYFYKTAGVHLQIKSMDEVHSDIPMSTQRKEFI